MGSAHRAGSGQGGEPFAVEHGGLGRPLRLLGVDVRHVLAGEDRVHVPGLRGDRAAAAPPVLGADRGEELPGQAHGEARPDIPLSPRAVDPGAPTGTARCGRGRPAAYVARRGHLLQLGELLVRGSPSRPPASPPGGSPQPAA